MHTLIPSMALLAALELFACSSKAPAEENRKQRVAAAAIAVQSAEPYQVANWCGKWTGVRAEYPLRNPDGEIIVVRGKEAKVGSSTFTFTIGAMGTVELVQSHDDGRVAAFSGKWKGRMEPGANVLTAIVCDLTANSTGAYRQYALMVDDRRQAVMCHGTSTEPPFEVEFSTP